MHIFQSKFMWIYEITQNTLICVKDLKAPGEEGICDLSYCLLILFKWLISRWVGRYFNETISGNLIYALHA